MMACSTLAYSIPVFTSRRASLSATIPAGKKDGRLAGTARLAARHAVSLDPIINRGEFFRAGHRSRK
jgi:hypothetical protein